MGIAAGIDGPTAQPGAATAAATAVAAVRAAAAATGVDFRYLLAQARVESGLDPAARAKTSSASGLYQFTAATWLETVRKHGAAHGLGWAADAIAQGAARAGSAARATILALRDNADAAALMAGEFARDNGSVLAARLGRAVGSTDLYMAHFLGAGGATHFLAALRSSPDTPAAAVVPAAAAANRSVFYAADGTPRSVAEVHARFARRFDTAAPVVQAAIASKPTGASVPATGTALPVARARLAYLLLAELGGR